MRKKQSPTTLDYRNPFMEVRRTKVDFGSHRKEYFVIELGPRVGVAALRDGCVLLTRQYRFLTDAYSWEIPGGSVDQGESPEAAAMRECLEETGVECSGLRKLVEYYPGLDNFNNRTTVYVSTGARAAAEFRPIESEVTEIRWFPVAEAYSMVLSGAILDGLTVVALLALKAENPGTGAAAR